VGTTGSGDVDNAGCAVEREGGVTAGLAGVSETVLWVAQRHLPSCKEDSHMTGLLGWLQVSTRWGMLTLTAQAAAMVPIQETVFANADRLSR